MLQLKILSFFLFVACLVEGWINISLVGRTGDGKSTFGNLLYRLMGGDPDKCPFSESPSANSHTHQPQSVIVQDLKITDHPGLVDSGGIHQDEKNIALIVNHLKKDVDVHAFLLVINEQSPRFDSACQSALKLIVDSFGPQILKITGVVFTKSYKISAADAQKYMSEELRPMINNVTGVDVSKMPFWQVDSHPEDLWGDNPDKLSSMEARNQRVANEIRRWASSNSPVDVSKAFPSEYEITTIIKEAQEKLNHLKTERNDAYEQLRQAQEDFRIKQDKQAEEMVKLKQRHADELNETIRKYESKYNFWHFLEILVKTIIPPLFPGKLNNSPVNNYQSPPMRYPKEPQEF
eukprot:scaffold911_cov162-Ochromonas_danica.AAC.16